jgi:uncharacterized protein (DUF2147 family)
MLRILFLQRNKPLRLACIGLALIWGVASTPSIAEELTPTGLWKTIDDKTGKPKGLVRIYEEKGRLFGKIERSFDPAHALEKCDKCPGDRKDRPMIGLVVLRGMEKHGNEYTGGDILDPDDGSVYRCKFKLMEQGKKLELRGFIGFSLLGRNQTWIREQ